MSRDQILLSHLRLEKLFKLKMLDFPEDDGREMYVSADILAVVTPPFEDTPKGVRLGEFRAWLDGFIEFGDISVAEDPDNKPPDAMLARVKPIEDEFWSIRVTEPEGTPGIRSLGGFHDTDAFIALTWELRETIATDFDGEVDEVRERWRDFFGTEPPFRGDSLNAYLTIYHAV